MARQIAEGLEEAHDKGIVHRDLKPANVKVTPEGKVKVLDFGLAKAWAAEASGPSVDVSRSPTRTHSGTQAGMILGTAAYMAPEQARGSRVDRRTDIWDFGAVLWPLLVSGVWKFPGSWSLDGRFVSYTQSEPGKPRDIWILPMTGDARPSPFAETPTEEWGSAFSPDGRFLAYASDESGSSEVFIRTFPASRAKWQVSTSGGAQPVWRGDGKELFYLTPDRRLVAVEVALTAGGLEPGPARPLFFQNAGLRLPTLGGATPYDATADGHRFLANLLVGEAESSPIVLQTGAQR